MLIKAFETATFHTTEFDATFQHVINSFLHLSCKGGYREKHDLRLFNITKTLGYKIRIHLKFINSN